MITIDELVDIVAKVAGKHIAKQHDLSKPQGVRGRNSDNSLLRKVLDWEPVISSRRVLAGPTSGFAASSWKSGRVADESAVRVHENVARSRAAETLFRELQGGVGRHEVRSVGTASHAARRITTRDLAWADVIAVMESRHLNAIRRHWPHHVEKSHGPGDSRLLLTG